MIMKKVFILLSLTMLFLLCLIACNKETPVCKHDNPEKIIVVEGKSPTCIETGLTQGMKCLNCETMVVPQSIIQTTACTDFADLPYTPPTCKENGLTAGVQCRICGTIVVSQMVLHKIECIESGWIVDIASYEEGKKYTECTMCNKKIHEKLISIVPSEGLEYVLNDDGESYSVHGIGTCNDTDLVIPGTYNGLPVISIDSNSFRDCTRLAFVAISDSVVSIGSGAFRNCINLSYIAMPNSITSIDYVAFEGCTSLTSVVIPDSVISIGSGAFYNCTNLTSIAIPNSVTSIGGFPFGACTNIMSIKVDLDNEHYKSIDGNLYTKDGKTLIQYSIGKQDANFSIPDSVVSIGSMAFEGCTSLTSMVITDSVTSIAGAVFRDCTNLATITIPDSVTSIGGGTFSGCTSLTSITIPDSVTSIGDSTFSGCTSLTSITIPESVTLIQAGAFSGCTNLKYVYYAGSEGTWKTIRINSYDNESLTNATIYYNSFA